MSNSTLLDVRRTASQLLGRAGRLLPLAAVALGACAGPKAPPQAAWLPDATGWTVRDVDDGAPAQWVVYQRDSLVADVKEIRIVGMVDAEPEATMRALRHRLLDPEAMPEGLVWEVLEESETEVVSYGLSPLPWPFLDREVTERMQFSHDSSTGVFRVDVHEVDPGTPPAKGVIRLPVVRNSFVVTPTGSGSSVLTSDSVHDLGGNFPNSWVYGPIANGMVEFLYAVRELSAAPEQLSN